MSNIYTDLYEYGLIPVIKISDVETAVPLAKALCAGGLPAAEITFRTDCAAEAIAAITKELPNMLVGAGTVLTPEQADRAVAAGAKFIVSPGLNPAVVKHCQSIGVPILPGCATPSEIEQALELGLSVVKFFPAEAAGGLPMIKAMSAPYGGVKFMPTGGINEENLLSYLNFNKIVACGGSFMVKDSLINEGKFDQITALTRAAVNKMLGFELAHVGVNCADKDVAIKTATLISTLFGMEVKTGNSSTFVGKAFEMMHEPYLGANGHIAIATNFIERAVAYFKRMGIAFNEESRKTDAKGNLKAIYFADEFAGFAIHLVQK
ncbi:MAG: bifunctional 4-hydroxy-2-oxoglutarate aldolase/2-dehydro-3-deoxy-phosphogluconate aldolase [Clostridia bacterium]|nr:bifunctional 4-hydroxy-2-oxoglutarate aldolase/2-dehydro-3-deoxy-phosphogluconate aldolase [Clostridia bacterium]